LGTNFGYYSDTKDRRVVEDGKIYIVTFDGAKSAQVSDKSGFGN
jgi:hypothetical protein